MTTKLSQTGLKATGQRAVILGIIRAGGAHLDADEIFRRAKKKLPRLSLSTVYRSLTKFKDTGIIEELHFDENHHHYEVKTPAEHQHLLCLGCGKITEFDLPLDKIISERAPEARDFHISNCEIRVSGYCPSCARKNVAP